MHFVGIESNLSVQLRVQIWTNICFMLLIKTLSLITRMKASKLKLFLISNIRRVVNVVFFLLGDYLASEF